MVFFNFLNFFAIFLEFSITSRLETDRNDNFLYLSFVAFSNLFWIEMKPQLYFFLIFLSFQLFFWNFQLRVGQERNGTTILFSLFLSLFQLFWLEIKPYGYLLLLRILLLFFWNFQLWVGWLGRIGTICFIISLSWPSSTYFGLKRSHNGISISRQLWTIWNDNLYFLSFSTFSNLF